MTKISIEDANKRWGFVDKLEYLIGFRYTRKNKGLHVPCSIDTIPSGLKGVDVFYVYWHHFPEFIAPDFNGRVKFNLGDIEVPQEWIAEAKKRYQENEEIAKAPRFGRFSDSWAVLPDNMRFFEDENGSVCLDLRKTDVKKINEVYVDGIDKILMRPIQMELPFSFPKKIAHHRGVQMSHSKPKIYEK